MKVGIDFDRVLFKTDEFKRYLEEKIEGFLENYPDGEGVYDPEEHASKLGIDVDEIFHAMDVAREYVYQDIHELEELAEHELVLVTRGDPVFQKEKVERAGVSELFDRVRIVEKKAKDHVDIDFLVDDSRHELDRVEIPGFHFARAEHSIKDIIEKVRQHET